MPAELKKFQAVDVQWKEIMKGVTTTTVLKSLDK
jgi:hypothetical protein